MKTIDEDIKSGQFKKIYLLYGDEAYLKKQYKDKLKKALVQPDDTMNFTAYEGKDTNPKEVIDLSEKKNDEVIRIKVPEGKHVFYALVKIEGFANILWGAPAPTRYYCMMS